MDDVISFGAPVLEALICLEEVLCRLSDFGLQLKAKKCTFMQTEVAFLGHIVGRTGLVCDPEKISSVRAWYGGGQERMGPRPPPWVPLLKSYGSSILSTSLGSKTVNNTSSSGLGGTKT